MVRSIVALVALVLASVVLATPAEAATYGVSVTLDRAKADVGTTVRLTGKVTGSKAARKTLTVQHRVGSGSWRKAGTTRTTSTGAYTVSYRVRGTGAQSLRVVAPATGSTKQGVSAARSLVGWTWVELYDAPYLTGGGVVSRGAHDATTIGGRRPPARTLGLGPGAYLYWNLGQRCDAWRTGLGLGDGDTGVSRTVVLEAAATVARTITGGQPAVTHTDTALTGQSSLTISRPDGSYLYVTSPQAHCSTSSLPVASD